MGWAVSCRGEVAVTRVSLSWQNLKQWEMLQFYINFVTEILFFWVTIMSVVKALVFPGVTYGCESWIRKKTECPRTDVSICGAGQDSWESLGVQGDQTSQSWRKSTLNTHWKDCWWNWSSNTLAIWCEEPVRYSLGRGRKEGETTSTEVGYLYSGKEGRQPA